MLRAEFTKHPLACLTLASYLPTNTGDVARKHIRDPELLAFIDIECYCWSTVLAADTPMINAGMVRGCAWLGFPACAWAPTGGKLGLGGVHRHLAHVCRCCHQECACVPVGRSATVVSLRSVTASRSGTLDHGM